MMPGVPNAAMGRQVERAGFDAVYISGAGMANATAGVPDIGLLTSTEVAQLAGYVANAVTFRQSSMPTRDLAERKMLRARFANLSRPAWLAVTSRIRNFPSAVDILPGKRSSMWTKWWEKSKRR